MSFSELSGFHTAGHRYVDNLSGETYYERGDSITPKLSSVKLAFDKNEQLFLGIQTPEHKLIAMDD